eukprot:11520507-Alexandrium_andersonii.AAC.1
MPRGATFPARDTNLIPGLRIHAAGVLLVLATLNSDPFNTENHACGLPNTPAQNCPPASPG